jgi:hypothetical protein
MTFYVIDADNLVSYSAEKDAPESFKTHRAAEKRATELAESQPGETIRIVSTVAEVVCPVGKPQMKSIKS